MSVAAVVPNLNYGHYLGKALQSLAVQTIPLDEIIVVDGGSLDESRQVAAEFGVRWIDAPPRKQADARNVGIAATRCEFIVPLDADDWIEPEFVEESLKKMEPGVGAVATGLVWPDGRIQWPKPPFTVEAFLTGNRMFSCSLFRRESWLQVGGYDTAPTYEDWLFWMSMVKDGWKISRVDLPLYHYCPHENSSTTNMKPGEHRQFIDYIAKKCSWL